MRILARASCAALDLEDTGRRRAQTRLVCDLDWSRPHVGCAQQSREILRSCCVLIVVNFNHADAGAVRACCCEPSARIVWNWAGGFAVTTRFLADLAGLVAALAWNDVAHGSLA